MKNTKANRAKWIVGIVIFLSLTGLGVKMVQQQRAQKAEAATKALSEVWTWTPGMKPASIEALIEQGGNVNGGSHAGSTPLHYAALCGVPVVKVLLDHGAKVNAKDIFGVTPLVCAVQASDPEAVRLLLSRGADPNIQLPTDRLGYGTALYHARQTAEEHQKKHSAKYAADLQIIQILKAAGGK